MCGPGPDPIQPTGDQLEQANINAEMWEYYQKNYRPLIQKYSQNVTNPTTKDLESKKVAGQINADIMKTVKAVPNAAANQRKIMDVAEVSSNAQTSGKAAVKVRQVGEQQNIINIGRGQTTKAMSGLDELGSMSVDTAIRAKDREQRREATLENAAGSTVGSVAGAGASIAMSGSRASRTDSGALIYGSPEYIELEKKWGTP